MASSLAMQACSEEPGVPAELARIEELAEDAFDQAVVGDVSSVQADATEMVTLWDGFRTTVATRGAAAAEVDATSSTIDAFQVTADMSTDPLVLARAANAVSGTLDALFGLYSPPVPSRVLRLDYLGREVSGLTTLKSVRRTRACGARWRIQRGAMRAKCARTRRASHRLPVVDSRSAAFDRA